ncbi:MAG: late competence development ComFB family protein [bacterium]|nr:late competence development ComFB family protein [bacterium]
MAIVNLMEDIVKSVTDKVVKNNKEFAQLSSNEDDIIAYVLNRVPPKYSTSERGILHGKLETKFEIQQKTDILMLVFEAAKVIMNGRASEISTGAGANQLGTHCFPHVIGEILEETTLTVIPGVEVSLYFGDTPVGMVDPTWKNPYSTNKATMGHYHFWPVYLENVMGTGPNVPLKMVARHPKFVDNSVDIDLEILDKPDMGKSFVAPITLMQVQDGVDLDFLYSEE